MIEDTVGRINEMHISYADIKRDSHDKFQIPMNQCMLLQKLAIISNALYGR